VKTRAAVLMVVLCALASGLALSAQDKPPAQRLVVICVDGVGYDLVQEMHNRGELKHLLPPAPVINAFPSLTNLGLTEILRPRGAPPARGYEDYFYDPANNRMAGGLFYRLSEEEFVEDTYRDLFDYHPYPVSMTLEYALPVVGPWMNGVVNLAALKRALKKSDKPIFLAYFDSSDLAAHLYGKWIVRGQLRAIDRLAGALSTGEQPVAVVVFSDHGNKLERLRRADFDQALRGAGFRLAGKVVDDRSVVLPRFGLVSAAVLYARPERTPQVAAAVVSAKGVDLAVYRVGEAVYVTGANGRARIERREAPEGVRYRYQTEEGDPLLLGKVVAELRAADRIDANGYASQDEWLRATAGHVYPDPLRRLWSAFDGLVEQPAAVIVSLQDGYYTGSQLLDLFAWVRATHGSLGRAQSLGMVLSTDPRLFRPERGPFTGANLFGRIEALASSGQGTD